MGIWHHIHVVHDSDKQLYVFMQSDNQSIVLLKERMNVINF